MEIIWRTAMSMDGRIAAARDNLDFLETIADEEAPEDFPAFLKSIDAIIVGASTLRWLIREGHGWPHGDIATWLVSRDGDLERQVGKTAAPFRRVEGDLRELVAAMEADGRQRAWLSGGGNLAGQLLAIDRIDEIEVTIAPVALGSGPSLFDGEALPLTEFRLVECRQLKESAAAIKWARR